MHLSCPYCQNDFNSGQDIPNSDSTVSKNGKFYRKSDKKWIQRYRCKFNHEFSDAYFDECYRQRKRYLNPVIMEELCSLNSMRRIAKKLEINPKTVARKMDFLGNRARKVLEQFNQYQMPCSQVQFDELETIEHTKLKPVSVPLAVEFKTRRILDVRVASMPAKGLLAAKSRKKYGPRKDERNKRIKELLQTVKSLCQEHPVLSSDQCPRYPELVQTVLPRAEHKTFKGKRGAVTGQGELKKTKWDPLFSLNHTCAMLRANIHRLIRKTWNTTKKLQRLEYHLLIYANYHNQFLLLSNQDQRQFDFTILAPC